MVRPDPLPRHAALLPAPRVPGYEMGGLLGRGGAGAVWTATRRSDGVRVAVKVVPVAQPEQADSLARELAVLGRVAVEGLVRLHEAVGLDGDPPAVALVLDHLGGGSLERAVGARGHLSVGESVTVLAPVARTLAGLHALGVVHGDVTPANVLLELSGRPFLADLGVARLVAEAPGGQFGSLWGTEGFVAPEVVDDGAPTAAADVYAVGALAWWCVTGEPPGHGALRRPLAEVAPGLPTAWCEVTTQALGGDPALRPSAAELALAYYDSAPCEPLRLVVGTDETSLLTQRLRRPATAAEPVPAGRRGLGGRLVKGRTAALATLVVLVTVLGASGLVAAGALGAPGWLGRAQPSQGATEADRTAADRSSLPAASTPVGTPGTRGIGTTTTPTTSSPTPPPTPPATPPAASVPAPTTPVDPDPTADRTAPRQDPRALMVALSSRRAEAMNRRSLAAVAELDAPGSGALAQDTALLAELTASGTTWQDVRFEVTGARTVAHTASTATVEAVVGTAAYRVVDGAGSVTTRAAVAGSPMRFTLVWSGGRWRVDRVSGTDG